MIRRKLIIGERIMYANGETPFNCVFPVSLKGRILPENLSMALSKLQIKHPLLRAGIQEDSKGIPWYTINEQVGEIPVRITERHSGDDWIKELDAELNQPFNLQNAPLARIVWIKGAETSELMIVLPHCICDGVTIVNLMRELLSFADKPHAEVNPYTSFRSVEELVPEGLLPGKAAIRKAKIFSHLANIFLTLKTRNAKPVSAKNYIIRWKLDKDLSAKIISSCKAEKTTVHTALGVAFLQSFREVRGKKARNKLICPVDIRKEVPAIKPDMMFAFAPIINLSLAKNKNFWELARHMKTELHNKSASLKLHEMLVLTEYFHASAPKMVKLLKTTKGNHDVTFSNMGKLDIPVKFSAFEVLDAYTPIASFPWRNPNTIVVTTFNGQMDFNFISEESSLPYKDAFAIKEHAMAILGNS